jgi:gamma-glutamyl AIG2-like cyclotransferase
VLAYGANRSLASIARKLGTDAPVPPVLVAAACLHDFDVVYSAHVSPYGAVPATLQPGTGHAVDVHVLHLDDAQVAAIDAYEPNYQRRELHGISLRFEDGTALNAAEAYISLHGCLAIEGGVCAIAERDQQTVLALVRDRLARDQDLDDFILAGIRDPALQASRTAELRSDAIPFRYPV